ncbi:competence protein ComEC [Metamycoplasma subdolum]|uniref:Competence protein ComEC n=2 Tax=Metamycoplasma subdolum TaxID=92407 RepID=A0A3L9ZXT4_9BACT|nr:ComEC/Rec2 family competence protein [Metamycoplasma subdolum]RMA77523.1 competence protein ComEC [Metamycoplasma subdolum]WPB50715.1 ComEC/Rec2 family competence protein [Metamycoplasma subdolum]
MVGPIDGVFPIFKNSKKDLIIMINGYKVLIKVMLEEEKYYLKIAGNISIINFPNYYQTSQQIFLEILDAKIEHFAPYETPIENFIYRYDNNAGHYISLLVFNKQNFNNKLIYKKLINLNIVHLFAISGFHFGLLFFAGNKIIKKVKFARNVSEPIILLILFLYLIVLNFPISASRAFLLLVLWWINEKFFNKKFTKITLLVFIVIFFIMINPWTIFSFSFIYSVTLTFIILIVYDLTRKFKSEFLRILLVLLSAYISSFFISLAINKTFSVLGFFYQLIFTPIISFSYIFSILFIWSKYLTYVYFLILDKFITICSNANIKVAVPEKLYLLPIIINTLFFISINIKKIGEVNKTTLPNYSKAFQTLPQ